MTMQKNPQPEPAMAAPFDACWSRIGVQGDRSCSELRLHIHCRNCPVYSAAARSLLDAPLPTQVLELATRHVAGDAASAGAAASAGPAQSAMVFRLQSEWFALPTAMCREVADMRTIHSLPHRRNGAVLGVANVRGELLVCVSLAALLGVQSQPSGAAERRGGVLQRLLVTSGTAGPVVFPVDEIDGVQRFHPETLRATPATLAKAQARYTQAILPLEKKTVGLLDGALLFHAVERSLA
jgi:chemotaxis-related protein WspD